MTTFYENFNGLNLTNSVYVDEIWLSPNTGVLFYLTHAAVVFNYPIDGNGILLRRSDYNSEIKFTVPSLGKLKFKYRKAETSARARTYRVEISALGLSYVHDLPPFGEGSGEDTTIHQFESPDLNMFGNVTVRVYPVGPAGNQQAVFDDFEWTDSEVGGLGLIRINGVKIKDPSTYSAQTSTLVDGGRNTEGFFIGDVIRHDMAKVEASWKILSDAEWSNILKLFNPTYGGAFIAEVTFLDQVTNTFQTRQMYVSDRKSSIKVIKDGNKIYYQNPSLSLVEV